MSLKRRFKYKCIVLLNGMRIVFRKQIMANSRTKQEQQWQAESDARTMAAYQEIMSDKARMGRAVKVARQQAKDLTQRANAMQNVAQSTSRNTVRNPSRRSK